MLNNINLDVKPGEYIAFVGSSGVGKTTICSLIPRFYEATKGNVLIDGINVKEIKQQSLRENIGIGDWKQMENTGKIYMLLHQVGLETFISQAFVNQLLGNEFGGRELSVGQWQKLAIARGMMKDSSVIFLDEPTAALDPLMETKVLKMFLKIAREKTAIIVSHRIGICKEVDKIIVMKEGKIAEIGNHEELLAEKGEYYRLYTMQQKWYEE